MKLKDPIPWKGSYDQSRQHIKKQRHYSVNKGRSSQGYGFSSGHVWMWELDYKQSWLLMNWCFWTMVLEKTLGSPLDCKEIQPVHPKGDQSWILKKKTTTLIMIVNNMYLSWRDMYEKLLLGWSKSLFHFFCTTVWKNPNEPFGKPNILLLSLEYNCFTMLYCFRCTATWISCKHTYIFSLLSLSALPHPTPPGRRSALSWAPVPRSILPLVICLTQGQAHMSVPLSLCPSTPSPYIHKSIPYICISIPAL